MDIDEAKRRVAAQDAELVDVETAFAQIASAHGTAALLATVRVLVEMVCTDKGPAFVTFYKLRFYKSVLALLHAKGIS